MDEVEKEKPGGPVKSGGRNAADPRSGGRSFARSSWIFLRGLLLVGLLGILVEREITRSEGWVVEWNSALTDFIVGHASPLLLPEDELAGPLQRRQGDGGDGEGLVYHARAAMPDTPQPLVVRFSRRDGASAYQQWPPGPIDLAIVLDGLPFEQRLTMGITFPIDQESDELSRRALRAQLREAGERHLVVCGVDLVPGYDDEIASLESIAELQVEAWDRQRWPLIPEVGSVLGLVDADLQGGKAFSRLLLFEPFPADERRVDGYVRIPLLAHRDDRLFPSLPLWLYLQSEGLAEAPVRLHRHGQEGGSLEVGGQSFSIDPSGCMVLPKEEAGRLQVVEVTEFLYDAASILEEPVDLLFIDYEGQPGLIVDDAGGMAGEGGWMALATAALQRGWISAPGVEFRTLGRWQLWLGSAFFTALILSFQVLRRRRRLFCIIPTILLYWVGSLVLVLQFLLLHDFLLPVAAMTAAWILVLAAPEPKRKTRSVRELSRRQELQQLLHQGAAPDVADAVREDGDAGKEAIEPPRPEQREKEEQKLEAPHEPVKERAGKGFLNAVLGQNRPADKAAADQPKSIEKQKKELPGKTAPARPGPTVGKQESATPMLELAEFAQSPTQQKNKASLFGLLKSDPDKKRRRDEAKARKKRAAKERAERERAEKERIEKERAVKERAEKERAEKEREAKAKAKAERERFEKERIEKERAARERAERERAERERAERERAERERAAKARAEKERVERARAEKEREAKARAEIERVAKARAEKERAERERIEKERAERERTAKERAERERAAKERAEKARVQLKPGEKVARVGMMPKVKPRGCPVRIELPAERKSEPSHSKSDPMKSRPEAQAKAHDARRAIVRGLIYKP